MTHTIDLATATVDTSGAVGATITARDTKTGATRTYRVTRSWRHRDPEHVFVRTGRVRKDGRTVWRSIDPRGILGTDLRRLYREHAA